MTVATREWYDITGGSFNRAPLVRGNVAGVYVTGTGSVPENQAELDAAAAAGVGVATIDQWPGLPMFSKGKARIADIESGAATIADFDNALKARRALGITEHVAYISYSPLPNLKASISDATGVRYWVADYAWSAFKSANLLQTNLDWVACQFGSPSSNPYTLVPGTQVTLSMANADISVGRSDWLDEILAGLPAPVPSPPPPSAPRWPFGPDDYLGTPRPDSHCHSGYYSSVDAHVVGLVQQRLKDRGWTITVDDRYGLNVATLNQGQTPKVIHAFQAEKGIPADFLCGPVTFEKLWTAPVTA